MFMLMLTASLGRISISYFFKGQNLTVIEYA